MILTIGHSTRSSAEFVDLLKENGVDLLVDVRRFPGSKRYPQFGRDALQSSLPGSGIEYRHMEALGGRRAPRDDSPNNGWRNLQFRGYADHMQSAEFRAALAEIIEWSHTRKLALMCAEAVPWRCHRQMIADALVARGIGVTHIISSGNTSPHELNPLARPAPDGSVTYPAIDPQLDLIDDNSDQNA